MARNGAYEFLTRPITDAWQGLIRRGLEAKREFNERGAQIEQFYSAGSGFMWQGNYLDRFMGGSSGIASPKFKVTINKAFEYVALMGPMLFWQMANRKVRPHRAMQLDPMSLSGGDELMAQFLNQLADQQATEDARNTMRAAVLEHCLNYFQREQYGGGLGAHSSVAVFEALLKGAGFLHSEAYRFPSSDRTLVGSFHVPTDDIIVDPDCRDPLWHRANWVAIRHRMAFWEVEQYFQLPPGSLRDYGAALSAGASWQSGQPNLPPTKRTEQSKDTIEWYEIFSRAGVGNKLCGTKRIIEPEFDEAAGDFVYLCVAKNCPYPLNMPSGALTDPEASDDFVREALSWPTEYWRDNKWPVSKLDFYPHSGTSPWPEPPLAPAIGELTCLNILISAYIQTAYDSRQQLIGVAKGMLEEAAQQKIKNSSESPLLLEVDTNFKQTIDQVITFLQRPEINGDIPKTIQFLMGLIEQRTGLSDMLYGQNSGSNPRSAAEYTGKMATVNIRPEYMQRRIADWQSEVADKEVLCMYTHVQASDIAEQLGPLGVVAYEQLVTNEQPEAILRGSKCFVEASDMARPNKERDAAMLTGMQQYLVPVLAGHMAQSNDPNPLNGLISAIGEATEIDVSQFLLPQPGPPDEQTVQLQQAMQQAELARLQAEGQKIAAEAQSVPVRDQVAQTDSQIKAEMLARTADAAQQQVALKQSDSNAKQQALLLAHQLKTQMASQQAGLKQQTAEHAMSIKERDAETKAAQAEHAAIMKQDDANLKAEEANEQMAMRQKEFEFSAIEKQAAIARGMEAHQQTMAEREQAARQKLALDMFKGHQGFQQAEATHQQGLQQADEKAREDARRSNLITYSKLLSNQLSAAQRQQRPQT